MGIYEHFAAKGITPVQRTGVIPSATGSGHVITCTARRWVVSGQLYCFQLPPARGRREACKPFTDPTSRITNVRINRAAAHRSKLSFGIFSALPASSRLDVQKVRPRCARPPLPKGEARGASVKRRGDVGIAPYEKTVGRRRVGAGFYAVERSGTSALGVSRTSLPPSARGADTFLTEGGRGAPAGNTNSIPPGRGKSCRKGVGNAVSFPRPHRP